jgi:hypothetical protein
MKVGGAKWIRNPRRPIITSNDGISIANRFDYAIPICFWIVAMPFYLQNCEAWAFLFEIARFKVLMEQSAFFCSFLLTFEYSPEYSRGGQQNFQKLV